MISSDISFLPQFEDQGRKFYDHRAEQDQWIEKDAIELLRDHGFNYIRLRIFVIPKMKKAIPRKKVIADWIRPWQWQNRVHCPIWCRLEMRSTTGCFGQNEEAVFWLDNMIVHGVYLTLSVNLTIPGSTGSSMI